MSGRHVDDDEVWEDDTFNRSFLHMALPQDSAAEPEQQDESLETRAYLMTGGRTGGGKADVSIETMVVAHPDKPVLTRLSPEALVVHAAADGPAMAVAEIAARVRLPLGVVQVLVGDLVYDGYLLTSIASTSLHDDVDFLERLIQRVEVL